MLCHVVQVIAGLKSNIEALEGESYELQQVRDQLDMRRSQLETHNQQLAIKTEHLTGIVVVAAMSDFAKYTTVLPPARKIPPCRGAAPTQGPTEQWRRQGPRPPIVHVMHGFFFG